MSAPIDSPTRPDWIEALAAEVARVGSQAKVADALGYSASTVSLVLRGKYPGDTTAIEAVVRGRLMSTIVECPVVGPLPTDQCTRHQQAPWAPHNPQRIAFYRACRGGSCPHSRVGGTR